MENGNDEAMQKAREAHMQRSKSIVQRCEFGDVALTERGLQANIGVISLFEEFTEALTLYLPEGFRTAMVLEHLEIACMCAKKAIAAHDQFLTKMENNKQDGKPTTDSKPN